MQRSDRCGPGRRPCVAALALLIAGGAAAADSGPKGELLVLEKQDRTLAFVDPGTNAVVARAPAGDDPHEIVVSEDGHTAYISNYGAGATPHHMLSVVDVRTRNALPPIELGALLAPHGLDLAAGKVYFTAEGSKALGRYDPCTRRLDWILGLGQDRTHMVVVARDASRILASSMNSNTVSIIDRDADADPSGWKVTTIPVGDGPEGFDVSPDGRELWVASFRDGKLSIVDLAQKRVNESLDLGTHRANRLKFTADGSRALVSDLSNGDLVVIDAKARRVVTRLHVGSGAAGILIPPNRSVAYVALSDESAVAAVDLATLKVVGRITTGKGPDGMAWAVSGAAVACAPAAVH
jgi:DNA-binding beta-propeller fold protein YncE